LNPGAQPKIGQPLVVRVLEQYPELCPLPSEPEAPDFWRSKSLPLGLFALVWNGVLVVVAIGVLIVAPVEARRLVRFGLTTLGTVAEKKATAGEDASYELTYRYQLGQGDSQEHFRTVSVTKAVFEQTELGAEVVVLYHPKQPKDSILYELAEYRAVR
jgi:hypothetical protein